MFYRQRIPEFGCARKETVEIDILATSRNGDRKIMQSIRTTSRRSSSKRKWNQLIKFCRKSTKVIPTEKTYAGNLSDLFHTEPECQESLTQRNIHNQQNSNEGLEYW